MNDGSIDLTNTDGSPAYTYAWTTLDGSGLVPTNEDQSGLTAGTYDVIVTDTNGCTITSSITLTEPTPLTESTTAFTYPSGNNISCFGLNDGSIDLLVSGGAGAYLYDWHTINGSGLILTAEDQADLTAGTYNVSVTDQNGCTEVMAIVLTEPASLTQTTTSETYASGDNISCFSFNNGSIDLTVGGGSPGYTYDWTTLDGSGLSAANEDQNTITAGKYDVTVTDVNGCTIDGSVTLIEPTQLSVSLNVLSDYFGQGVSCIGHMDGSIQAVTAGGSPGFVYSWTSYSLNSNSTLTGLGEGNYDVSITDTNGCVASASVTLDANPLPTLNPDPAVDACEGQPVTFSSNPALNDLCFWSISNGIQLDYCGPNTIYIDEPGCYDASLYVTNEFGCVDSITMIDYICIHDNPIAAFTADNLEPTILDNIVFFENESTGGINYDWEISDGSYYSDVDVSHDFPMDGPGVYSILLTAYDAFGCSDTTSINITVKDELLFYIPNAFTPDGDEYNNIFIPQFGAGYSPDNYSLVIYNRWGETIFESKDLSYGWDGTLAGIPVQNGVFTWKMSLQSSEYAVESDIRREYYGHVNLLR